MFATFANERGLVQLVIDYDRRLTCRVGDLFHEHKPELRESALLFMRMFSSFRAAVRLLFAGQLWEGHVLLRNIIECAVYAWACGRDTELARVWANRENSDEARRECKHAFRWIALRARLAAEGTDFAARIHREYESLIESGAHPNRPGIELGVEVEDLGANKRLIQSIFLHGEASAIQMGLLDVLRAMDLGYELLRRSWVERIRLLGIDREVDDIRRRLGAEASRLEVLLPKNSEAP